MLIYRGYLFHMHKGLLCHMTISNLLTSKASYVGSYESILRTPGCNNPARLCMSFIYGVALLFWLAPPNVVSTILLS
jgi:hypothetical protein